MRWLERLTAGAPRLLAQARRVRASAAGLRGRAGWPATSSRRRGLLRVLGSGLGLFAAFWLLVPVVSFDDPLSTVVLDRDGALVGASIARDGQWRFGVADAVPEKFVLAITCFEDRRFFHHPGVDPLALGRAALVNLRSGRVTSGGSTLTMQVVRLSRRGRPRSLGEKAIEAVLALRLSLAASKRQVLQLYAAYAPFGGNTVGLDAAAFRYFGREPARLSWAETATLAVLPNAPSLVHPGRNRERLLAKRNRLLDALAERGTIDRATAELARREPLPPAPEPMPMLAPHLVARLSGERRGHRFRVGDASPWVRTTLRRSLQERASEIVARHRNALVASGAANAAALVVDVRSGGVLAYVGNHWPPGPDERGEHVDVVQAPRSTGSVLKPLLYASMLEAGELLPRQLVADVPTHIGSFHPENFDRSYGGAVPASQALARSLNVPAVRLLRAHGVDRFAAVLRRLGLETLDQPGSHYGLALVLGGAEGTLLDVTGIYAGLARSALAAGPREAGAAFFRPTIQGTLAPEPARAPLSPAASYLTLQAMLEVERPGDELGWRAFASARKVAWKTGTSYGYRDAWAIGVTPAYAVGVWVGNASGEGVPALTGHSAAAPLLFELVGALPASGWFAPPGDGLVDVDVCARSGMRAGPDCAERRGELVPRAGLDTPACSYCRVVHTDADEAWQLHAGCAGQQELRPVAWFVLPPTLETYYRRQHAEYRPPPPYRPDCREALSGMLAASLSLVYPREGAFVYVPRELDGSLGRVVFEAAHRDPAARVFWHLDDGFVGETSDLHQLALAPGPGAHRLVLVDERGETVERRFTVVGRGERASATLSDGPVVQLVRTAGS